MSVTNFVAAVITSCHHRSSSRSQPAHHCVPFSSQILGQLFKCCHGDKHEEQFKHLYDGLVFAYSVRIFLLYVREHLISVCFLYDPFGPRPRAWSHQAVLGCTARSEKALEGQERVPEKEPSQVWFATNQIRQLVFVRNAGNLPNKD